jgi:CheY-like chemotaxis protein
MGFSPCAQDRALEQQTMAYILLVEDDRDCAAMFRHLLENEGHRVQHVEHGHAALVSALSEREPDLVIADFRMPEMDGKELTGLLHVTLPDCPVIIVTGYIEQSNHALMELEPNVVAVLEKPPQLDKLIGLVDKALAPAPSGDLNPFSDIE